MAFGNLGFVDKRTSSANAVQGTSVGTAANYASESALNTRLGTINGTYFNATRLAQMTLNDKIYALRLADDPTSF